MEDCFSFALNCSKENSPDGTNVVTLLLKFVGEFVAAEDEPTDYLEKFGTD